MLLIDRKAEVTKLQGFQNRFAKKILAERLSSEEAVKEPGWLDLVTRRRNYRAMLAHRVMKGEHISHLH